MNKAIPLLFLALAFCVADLTVAKNIPQDDDDSNLLAIIEQIDQTLAAAGTGRGISFKQIKESAKNIIKKISETATSLARKYPDYAEKGLKYVHDTIIVRLDKEIENAKDSEVMAVLLKMAKSVTTTLHDELKKKLLEQPTTEAQQTDKQLLFA